MLRTVAEPDQATADLIALAMAGGAPDNVTCIVADVLPATVPVATLPAAAVTSR